MIASLQPTEAFIHCLPAQAPAGEYNCPTTMAIPATVGTGNPPLTPNQNLCLPELALSGNRCGPVAFIVQRVEPGDHVDSKEPSTLFPSAASLPASTYGAGIKSRMADRMGTVTVARPNNTQRGRIHHKALHGGQR